MFIFFMLIGILGIVTLPIVGISGAVLAMFPRWLLLVRRVPQHWGKFAHRLHILSWVFIILSALTLLVALMGSRSSTNGASWFNYSSLLLALISVVWLYGGMIFSFIKFWNERRTGI